MLHLEPFDGPGPTLERLLARILPEFQPGTRVFVKPNWCARKPPLRSENTTPEFMAALLLWLTERGAQVTVGHAALLTPPDRPYLGFANLIKIARCDELLEDFLHVRFVDLETEPMALRHSGEVSMLVPRLLSEQDLVINCARLKTHIMSGVSVGAKNLMGLVPDNEKLRMHRDGLNPLIAHLANMVWPELTLVEADVGMEGEGPHHGSDIACGYYLGGDDLVEVDAAGCWLMGVDPTTVEHVSLLAELRGRSLPSLSRDLEPHARHFRRSRAYLYHTRRVRVWPGDSCSTCHVAAQAVESYARENPHKLADLVSLASMLYVKGLNLYMGHQPEGRAPPEGEFALAIGDCAKAYAERWKLPFIGGCPVAYHEVQPALLELLKRIDRDGTEGPPG